MPSQSPSVTALPEGEPRRRSWLRGRSQEHRKRSALAAICVYRAKAQSRWNSATAHRQGHKAVVYYARICTTNSKPPDKHSLEMRIYPCPNMMKPLYCGMRFFRKETTLYQPAAKAEMRALTKHYAGYVKIHTRFWILGVETERSCFCVPSMEPNSISELIYRSRRFVMPQKEVCI